MKSTILTSLACLILGIAIGWIAKPAPPASSTDIGAPGGAASAKTSPATPPGKLAHASTLPSKALRPTDDQEPGNPAITMGGPKPAMQERFQNMLLEQARKRSSSKVTDLAETLGLSAGQTAELQAYFDARIAEIAADGSMPNMMTLSKLQSNASVDAALADILTDEQSATYEDMKTKERNRKVESRAYKDLARVNSVLDLDDDQKNAVYDILYEEAGRKVDQSSNSGSAMAMVMNGHGIDIDIDDIGLGGIIESASTPDENGEPAPTSREDLVQRMRERHEQRINEQVERLAPALTPEQKAQYRKHLESRNSGMFQNMMIEGADGAGFKIETSLSE